MAPSLSSRFLFICFSSCSFSTRRSSRSRTWKRQSVCKSYGHTHLPSTHLLVTHHFLNRQRECPFIGRWSLASIWSQTAQGCHAATRHLPYGHAPRPRSLQAQRCAVERANGVDVAHRCTRVQKKKPRKPLKSLPSQLPTQLLSTKIN